MLWAHVHSEGVTETDVNGVQAVHADAPVHQLRHEFQVRAEALSISFELPTGICSCGFSNIVEHFLSSRWENSFFGQFFS